MVEKKNHLCCSENNHYNKYSLTVRTIGNRLGAQFWKELRRLKLIFSIRMIQKLASVSKCSKLKIKPFLLPSRVATTPKKFSFCCLGHLEGYAIKF